MERGEEKGSEGEYLIVANFVKDHVGTRPGDLKAWRIVVGLKV